MMRQLLLTTNWGIEDIVADEFRRLAAADDLDWERVDPEPFDRGGRVLVEMVSSPREAVDTAERMRSIHHVLRYVHQFELPDADPLDAIEQALLELELPEVEAAETFRVTSNRNGDHEFTSVDVQKAAGAGVDRRHETSVDLEDYDVDVRVDVRDRECLVGIQHTIDALSKRFPHEYAPLASLKANVAYAMLQLAHIDEHEPETLLDPFCGAATILMEAAETEPELEIVGSDISVNAVEGARENLEAAGLADRVDVREADARELVDAYPRGFADLIVTNPPYGMRLDAGMDFGAFYRDVLGQFVRTLSREGRVVMLVHKRGVFRDAIGNYPQLDIRHVRVVETGGLYPGIFVLQKRR